ncbi:MAG: hypothetical protein HY587_05350 [Candidatus Omnitrophica bacterium]|nr:hypothetical protein [Candidatus Omnitrophota bacterium]
MKKTSFFPVFLLMASDAIACPMCKYGLVSVLNPDYVSRLAKGYYWSILLLLTVPILLVTGMIFLVAGSARRNQ